MKVSDAPIIVDQFFDAGPAEVWRAITSPDAMRQWFFPEMAAFEPVAGFETRFDVRVEDRVYGHLWSITEVIEGRRIEYDWRYAGYPGRALVSFRLTAAGEGTRLRLTFTVLEDFPGNIPEFRRESCEAGWDYFIRLRLKEFLHG